VHLKTWGHLGTPPGQVGMKVGGGGGEGENGGLTIVFSTNRPAKGCKNRPQNPRICRRNRQNSRPKAAEKANAFPDYCLGWLKGRPLGCL
jgi:hypothetical protein